MRISIVLASVLFLFGCQHGPTNRVVANNRYNPFPAQVEWQDKDAKPDQLILKPGEQGEVCFDGMTKPGPIKVFKIDEGGNKVPLIAIPSGSSRGRKVYRIQ